MQTINNLYYPVIIPVFNNKYAVKSLYAYNRPQDDVEV